MVDRVGRFRGRRRSRATFVLVAVAAILGVVPATTSSAQPPASGSALVAPAPGTIPVRQVEAPVMSCSALLTQDFSRIPGAPSSLLSATTVGTGAAQYCDVTGMIAPQTQFELRLPTTTYQGRYLQTGCGGNCGVVRISVAPSADTTVALGDNTFAVSTNNEGHIATGTWDVWGAGGAANPLRAQFGYIADHLNAVVAKSIISVFYGQSPAYSYFDGYSDGGRAAVQEAQRYPHDFDGILAGAPAVTIQDALTSFAWAAQHLVDSAGNAVLDTAAVTALHTAAITACDGLDGAIDGQIGDPRLCHWDPVAIQCSASRTTNCLTAVQVAAARAMYSGPSTANGQYLWPGGQSYGTELFWPGFAQSGVSLAGSNLRFLAFAKDPATTFTWRDLKFTTQTWQALQAMGALYDSNNNNHPDLNSFARSGGKLIVWQSWQDEAAGAYNTEDWYAQVADQAGGYPATQRFARVFQLPTGSHGQASSGAVYKLNILPQLVNWVEQRQAPTQLTAWQTDSSGAVTRTYPSYPLPATSRYSGTGNVDDAANWRPATTVGDLHFQWLGDPRPAPFPYRGWPFASAPSHR